MQAHHKDDQKSGAEGDAARDHGDYAKGETEAADPRAREKGDYHDPGKRLTGRGNASKGPWKEQGGAGHGEDYGGRDKDTASQSGHNGEDTP